MMRAQRKRYHVHPERGKETIFRTAQMIAGHDLNHIAQIQRLAKSRKR
jgi:hypothetical protein